jgi:hypothetical protein
MVTLGAAPACSSLARFVGGCCSCFDTLPPARGCASQEALTIARFSLNLQAMQRGTRGMQSGIVLGGAPAKVARATRRRPALPSHPSLCSGTRPLGAACPSALKNTLCCQGGASTEQEVLGGRCNASASGGIACSQHHPGPAPAPPCQPPVALMQPRHCLPGCLGAGGRACLFLSNGLIWRLCRLSMGERACLSIGCCPPCCAAASHPPWGSPQPVLDP